MLKNHNCCTGYFVLNGHNYSSSLCFAGVGQLRQEAALSSFFSNLASILSAVFMSVRLFCTIIGPESWCYCQNLRRDPICPMSSILPSTTTSCSKIQQGLCSFALKACSVSKDYHQIAPTQVWGARFSKTTFTDLIPSPIHQQRHVAVSEAQPDHIAYSFFDFASSSPRSSNSF